MAQIKGTDNVGATRQEAAQQATGPGRTDLLDSLGHHDRAAAHRALAEHDDAAGDADEVGLASERPSPGADPPQAEDA